MIDPSRGSQTGNPLIDQYISGFSAGGGQVGQGPAQEPRSPFDKYRTMFSMPDPPLPSWGARGFTSRLIQESQRRMSGGPRVGGTGTSKPSAQEAARMAQGADIGRSRKRMSEDIRKRNSDRKRLEALARRAGLIGDDFLPSELDMIWQQAIDEAEASSAMGKELTPWEILQHWAKDPRRARNYAQPGASAPDLDEILPPEKRTVVSKHTNTALTDPKTARAVVLSGLRSYLGRKPTNAEVRAFRSYLNDLERQNPTVSTTTSEYEGGELQSSNTVTEGGAPSPTAALETYMDDEHSDEAFAYRMASEGDSLLRAIVGSIV